MNIKHMALLAVVACMSSWMAANAQRPADSAHHLAGVPHATNKSRKIAVATATAAFLGGTFYFLDQAWYRDYERVPLHSFDDSREWLQMDKAGHVWTAFNTAGLSYNAWRWAGLGKRQSILLGSITGMGYLGIIEYLDGRSAQWGWSWGDMSANVLGTSVFAVQQAFLDRQALRIKWSGHVDRYGPELRERANGLFGQSLGSRLLKDYNAQTYWLSANLGYFLKSKKVPQWLNISIGMGAEGMLGGFSNIEYGPNRAVLFDRRDIKRYRQFYLSADIDFSRIQCRNKLLKSVLEAINTIKVPFPSLELLDGSLKGHFMYF